MPRCPLISVISTHMYVRGGGGGDTGIVDGANGVDGGSAGCRDGW